MKGKKYFMKVMLIGAIFLLTLPSIQGILGEKPNIEQNDSEEEDINDTGDTNYYENCTVIIFGNCKSVGGALTWIFGLYYPLTKKHIWINAGGETLNALITGGGSGIYFSCESLFIDMYGTNGFLFWGGKSLLMNNNHIVAICNVKNCYVTS